MEKIIDNIEKLSIRSRPKKYKKMKDACKKLQANIDRRLINEKSGVVPTLKQDIEFYRIFIPNLNEALDKHELEEKTNKWIKSQIQLCAKYITVFDKGHLTDRA